MSINHANSQNHSTNLMHNLKDLMGISDFTCSSRLYWGEKLAAPKTNSGISNFPIFVFRFVVYSRRKEGELIREIRSFAMIKVMRIMRYRCSPVDRFVLVVIRIFGRRVVGNLDRIEFDDHEKKISPGRGLHKDRR